MEVGLLGLASEGVAYQDPYSATHSPYALEVDARTQPAETLVAQIEKFMLKPGSDIMFMGGNMCILSIRDCNYADMVFYCKPLRAYVPMELKANRPMSSTVEQLNKCLSNYAPEVNDMYDNPPIGIILRTDKNNVSA